jgi:thiopurine S-methyltransferase
MEAEFWHQRWRENRIGFHQQDTNPYLKAFWAEVPVKPGEPVFVPLCGKSLDIRWLQQQRHPVIGVELSSIAVEAFFEENDLSPVQRRQGPFSVYEADGIRIFCGDFFDLDAAMLDGVKAVYDRASLIALPPDMRPVFVEHLTGLLPAAIPLLLITLEYPHQEMSGPPFSVADSEVQALFSPAWSLRELHKVDVLADEPRYRERGLSSLIETIYLLQRRP